MQPVAVAVAVALALLVPYAQTQVTTIAVPPAVSPQQNAIAVTIVALACAKHRKLTLHANNPMRPLPRPQTAVRALTNMTIRCVHFQEVYG